MSDSFQDAQIMMFPQFHEGSIGFRCFTLTKDEPSRVIGRSSKNKAKNLQAAQDNAFFDSPVMSRTHALIEADGKGKITITDTDSMHGTYSNGQELAKNKAVEILDTMKLTFGNEVCRDTEKVPPKTIEIVVQTLKSSNGNNIIQPTRAGYGLTSEELILSDGGSEEDYDEEDELFRVPRNGSYSDGTAFTSASPTIDFHESGIYEIDAEKSSNINQANESNIVECSVEEVSVVMDHHDCQEISKNPSRKNAVLTIKDLMNGDRASRRGSTAEHPISEDDMFDKDDKVDLPSTYEVKENKKVERHVDVKPERILSLWAQGGKTRPMEPILIDSDSEIVEEDISERAEFSDSEDEENITPAPSQYVHYGLVDEDENMKEDEDDIISATSSKPFSHEHVIIPEDVSRAWRDTWKFKPLTMPAPFHKATPKTGTMDGEPINIPELVTRTKLAFEQVRKADEVRERAQGFFKNRREFAAEHDLQEKKRTLDETVEVIRNNIAPSQAANHFWLAPFSDCTQSKKREETTESAKKDQECTLPGDDVSSNGDAGAEHDEEMNEDAQSTPRTSPMIPDEKSESFLDTIFNEHLIDDDTEDDSLYKLNTEDMSSEHDSDSSSDSCESDPEIDMSVEHYVCEKPSGWCNERFSFHDEEDEVITDCAFKESELQKPSVKNPMSLDNFFSPTDESIYDGWHGTSLNFNLTGEQSSNQKGHTATACAPVSERFSTHQPVVEVAKKAPSKAPITESALSTTSRKRRFDTFVDDMPYDKENLIYDDSMHATQDSFSDAQPRGYMPESLLSEMEQDRLYTVRPVKNVDSTMTAEWEVEESQAQPPKKKSKVESRPGWGKSIVQVAVPTLFGAILGSAGMFAALVATAPME